MEKFYLDLETILRRLDRPGELVCEIPAKKLRNNKTTWKAHIRVEVGQVMSCQIYDNRGAVVSMGEVALESLFSLGELEWEIKLDQTQGSGPLRTIDRLRTTDALSESRERNTDPLPLSTMIPIRTVSISLHQMNQTGWPREYRLIFILVDGTRNSEMIASMLKMSVREVEQILHELKKMLLVDFKT